VLQAGTEKHRAEATYVTLLKSGEGRGDALRRVLAVAIAMKHIGASRAPKW
jgi:hypothetical protein